MPDDAMIKIQGSTVGKAHVQRACEIRMSEKLQFHDQP
jgi:hypothetical protein